MTTREECCGWLGWAELAGIDADGSPLKGRASGAPLKSPAATRNRTLPFITAALRHVLRDFMRVPRAR